MSYKQNWKTLLTWKSTNKIKAGRKQHYCIVQSVVQQTVVQLPMSTQKSKLFCIRQLILAAVKLVKNLTTSTNFNEFQKFG